MRHEGHRRLPPPRLRASRSGYGRVPVLHGDRPLGRRRRDARHPRPQRHGEVDAPQDAHGDRARDRRHDGLRRASTSTRERSSGRAKLGIGYVPQGRGIFPNLTVRDNLRMGVAAHAVDEDEAIERVLADFPRLVRLLDRDGGALSGGEQQLLALARCLISRARPRPARRADRRHPALDHRRDHRPPEGAQQEARRRGRARGAEPRLHHLALGPGAPDPEGPDRGRGRGLRSRRPRADRGIHRLRRQAAPSRDAAPAQGRRRRCTRPPRRRDAAKPSRPQGPAVRKDRLHDRPAPDPRPDEGDRGRARHAHVRRPDPGIPRHDAGHARRLRRRGQPARLPAAGALPAHLGLPADAGREPDERLVREDRDPGRAARAARSGGPWRSRTTSASPACR